jgi:hypothetical protein
LPSYDDDHDIEKTLSFPCRSILPAIFMHVSDIQVIAPCRWSYSEEYIDDVSATPSAPTLHYAHFCKLRGECRT